MVREFKNDNDYSVIVFNDKGFLVKMQYVTSLGGLIVWLNKSNNYSSWTTLNVYVRRGGRFIGQFKKGEFIPSKPQ